jgi:ribosomal protein L22
MADEKKDPKRTTARTGAKPEGAKARGARAGAKDGEPRARKPGARAKAGAGPKAEAKPERVKDEAKAKRKPRARGRAAGAKAPATPRAKPQPAEEAAPRARARARKPEPAPARPVVRARAKYVRSSARKARLVMDHVRGRTVNDAQALLRHSPRGIARDIERLLASAVANAENNHELVGDDLFVKEIYADEGPTLRRFRARAQGRATRIRKRTSHLTVGLSPKE